MSRPASRLARLARLAPLAGAAALVLAAPLALAKGDSTGKSPPAAAPVAKAGGTYADLLADFARREAEQEKAQQKARYDAVAAYVKANGSAKDAELARAALVDLADEMGDSTLVLRHADEYLAAHPSAAAAVSVRLTRAAALGDLGRLEDAKKAYEELISETEDPRRKFGIVVANAFLLADFGELDAAKASLEKFKEENSDASAVVDRQLEGLKSIGTDPEAFPAGVKDLDGKPVSLADFKGKLLFIDFWATWCGPCVGEVPHVVAAYDRFHAQGFDVLGVTLDGAEDADKVRLFTAEHRMPWRQQHDSAEGSEGNALATAYGVESIPHTILVGRDGKILRVGLRGASLAHTVARTLAREKSAPSK